MDGKRPVLIVEDDDVDQQMIRHAFKELKITNPVQSAQDGLAALQSLRDEKIKRPCIILLDLNMPRMNGIEFLREVDKDNNLKTIPVVVLSTSKEEEDKVKSFRLGVAGYMLKPIDYNKFVEVIRAIDVYWTLSEIPE